MKREEFKSLLKERILVFDGAMGTMLQRMGLKTSECPEAYNLKEREVIKCIHQKYIEAGCNIIQTNTFGGNRIKLSAYGYADQVEEINKQAVSIAREAAGDKHLVAGDIGPTGKLLYPLGQLTFEEVYDVFYQQARFLIDAGVDLINIETMSDVKEAKAAIMAVRDAGDVPIICSMTFQENMRTLTGVDPETVATLLEALDVDVIGANCGFGPDMMAEIIKRMYEVTDCYLIAQPNAGLPKLINGESVFNLSPEKMASYIKTLVSSGSNIIGGCCGTTPAHLKLMVEEVHILKPKTKKKIEFSKLASARKTLIIHEKNPTTIMGGYINPTSKKILIDAIKEGKMSVLSEAAAKQVEAGAHIINVNVGIDTKNEDRIMKEAVSEIQRRIQAPISIDTVHYDAMEEALKTYEGKALLNSTNGKEDSLKKVLELAKRYGAAIVGLTLDERGIPEKAEDRLKIAEKIVSAAIQKGLRREDIFIDTLVLTAGAQQHMALECIKAIPLVKRELGVKTILGVENISHGLPNRRILDSAFLAMALEAGLDIPIINPYSQEILYAIKSADVLLGKDKNASLFIQWHDQYKKEEKTLQSTEKGVMKKERPSMSEELIEIIKQGDKSIVLDKVQDLLKEGLTPVDIINQCLIPALEIVGENYEKQVYFLPQLLLAAETAQKAFGFLKQRIGESADKKRGTIVIATVKGDIHDIGKNIVSIMLENHGFHVIDLGKDVEREVIIETAIKEKADIIGLSALMTTTMMEMKRIKEALKDRNLQIPLLIGGAVVTEAYAKEIQAYYAEDAIEAIRVANTILKEKH